MECGQKLESAEERNSVETWSENLSAYSTDFRDKTMKINCYYYSNSVSLFVHD